MSFRKLYEEILEPGEDTLKKKFKITPEYSYFSVASTLKELDVMLKHVEDDAKQPRGRSWDMDVVKKAYDKRLSEIKCK